MKVRAEFAVMPYGLFFEIRGVLISAKYGTPTDTVQIVSLLNQLTTELKLHTATVELPDPEPATVAAAARCAAVGEGRS